MKQGGKLLFTLIALLAFSLSLQAASLLKVANGRLEDVAAAEKKLILSHKHPVNGKIEELIFQVDDQTGFPENCSLGDLKKGEPLTVDYEEDDQGMRRAVQIKRLPLSGVPVKR